jgi:hypothetical protein
LGAPFQIPVHPKYNLGRSRLVLVAKEVMLKKEL